MKHYLYVWGVYQGHMLFEWTTPMTSSAKSLLTSFEDPENFDEGPIRGVDPIIGELLVDKANEIIEEGDGWTLYDID